MFLTPEPLGSFFMPKILVYSFFVLQERVTKTVDFASFMLNQAPEYLRPSDQLYHECRRSTGDSQGWQLSCAVCQQVPLQYRALQADDD